MVLIVFDNFFFLGGWGMSGGNGGGPVTWGRRGLLSKVYIRRLGGWWMLQFSNFC